MHTDYSKFTSYAKRFFSGTLLSRFSGMFRDIAMAFAFGDHPSVAAFMVAFRFSQFFRRIFGEGSLQATFIPHYEQLRIESPKRAALFFRELTFYVSLILIGLILFSSLSLKLLLLTPWAKEMHEIFDLCLWMMPSLLFACLYALNTAGLQCHNSFFLGGVAPVFCNLLWIAGCFWIKNPDMKQAMGTFSIFVVLGFLLQWLITVPKTFKKMDLSFKEWFSSRFFLPKAEIRLLLKAFFLSTIGVGATQINSTLDALFAHLGNIKGPVYLWYAIRIEQLPLALFAIALISAITPTLSRAIKEKKLEEGKALFIKSKVRLSLFMLLCTFGVFSLAIPGITLIFKHGKFESNAIFATASCLYAYGLGLLPSALVTLYSVVFYAFGDFKTPTKASVISVVVNVFLNALFVFGFNWAETSVAIATSLSAVINWILLRRTETGKTFLLEKGYGLELFKTALAGIIAMVFTALFQLFFFDFSPLSPYVTAHAFLPSTFSLQLFQFFISALIFTGTFLGSCALLKCSTLLALLKEILRIKKQNSSLAIEGENPHA